MFPEPRSREKLVAFLHDLYKEFRARGHERENNALDDLLEALATWVNDSLGAYRHEGEQTP